MSYSCRMVIRAGGRSGSVPGVPRQSRPRLVVKSFRVSERLWRRVLAHASREEINPSDVVRAALEAYLPDED